jgi:hypothetical protein
MTPEQYQQRDQYILTERKAGETLKAIAAQVGCSPERIRQIILIKERREKYRKFLSEAGLEGLSMRSISIIQNTMGRNDFTWRDWPKVADIPDSEFLYGRQNKYLCGRKHLREIRQWQAECSARTA